MCRIASPQKFCGMFIAFSILRVVDNIVLFRLSTTPFCCGEYGVVSCLAMPLVLQYLLNSADVNSPPLPVLSIFNLVCASFSTFSLNSLNVSNA
ncbi:hypothetical protein HanXRQr2_Chr04g0185531 [Helianthus annuus]|uniref:Uncharacterized protein n=1 Tax=Helianthus annuus TaxID=4232 RepID=A0A9K3NSP2_HELAN|nr:hypothetical protein HanXRQr2_Chr04g0185531 [Helianthus annuus]KAJ0932910.1 hypothetical protein HanPSC8_Chr04g0179081 [Helianthus annuus]